MKNELLKRMFAHSGHDVKIVLGLLEKLAGEKRTQEVLDELFPSAPVDAGLFEGRRLDEYRGLSREQLKSVFGFDDAKVDELYETLGVVDNSADVDGVAEDETETDGEDDGTGGGDAGSTSTTE